MTQRIPIFCTCSSCNRNLENNPKLWHDLYKKICKCCECFGLNKELIGCKRAKCSLYKYLDYDYIVLAEDEVVTYANEAETETPIVEEDYDENSNKCFCCSKELSDFIHINIKVTKILYANDTQTKDRKKIKVCPTCWTDINKIFKVEI